MHFQTCKSNTSCQFSSNIRKCWMLLAMLFVTSLFYLGKGNYKDKFLWWQTVFQMLENKGEGDLNFDLKIGAFWWYIPFILFHLFVFLFFFWQCLFHKKMNMQPLMTNFFIKKANDTQNIFPIKKALEM